MTHYQKPDLCRVLAALQSVQNRALGKDDVCRVLAKKHSANTTYVSIVCRVPTWQRRGTRHTLSLPSALEPARGKGGVCASHARRPCTGRQAALCTPAVKQHYGR